jgi:hypothetical protein
VNPAGTAGAVGVRLLSVSDLLIEPCNPHTQETTADCVVVRNQLVTCMQVQRLEP